MKIGWSREWSLLSGQTAASLLILACSNTLSQDAVRGERLFNDTAAVTGAVVASCAGCHGNVAVLREMIRNRGGRTDDPKQLARWLDAVIEGAQPGARNAKAQFVGVLTSKDMLDLAGYIASTEKAEAPVWIAGLGGAMKGYAATPPDSEPASDR